MNSKYNFKRYVRASRWMSYWYQISEILSLDPRTVLEIGAGEQIVSNIIKNQGIKITTLDIDKELKPDIIGNILNLPFENNSFDLVIAAEVLEHLPFSDFEKALVQIKKVTKKNVLLSLPHFGPCLSLSFKMPLLKQVKIFWKLPYHPEHNFSREHYWEIGKKGYSAKKIREIIKKYFKLKKEFIPFENKYHHFYILEK